VHAGYNEVLLTHLTLQFLNSLLCVAVDYGRLDVKIGVEIH
jgi:hypothetical protein